MLQRYELFLYFAGIRYTYFYLNLFVTSIFCLYINSSFSTSAAEKSMKPGEKYSLRVSVSPSNATNKSLKYSSSNTAVASVDGAGIVTAKKGGNAFYEDWFYGNFTLSSINFLSNFHFKLNGCFSGCTSSNYTLFIYCCNSLIGTLPGQFCFFRFLFHLFWVQGHLLM